MVLSDAVISIRAKLDSGTRIEAFVLLCCNNLDRTARRWPLERQREFDRRVHPHLSLVHSEKAHRRGIRMDGSHVMAGIGGEETEHQVLADIRNGLIFAIGRQRGGIQINKPRP